MVIWGFVVILSAMMPNRVGPYQSVNDCYARLSEYMVQIETSDTANQYRGNCFEVSRRAGSVEPAANAQWLTSAQLKALSH